MRSIKRAYDLADDVDPDTLEKVTSLTDDYAIGDEKRNHDSNLDFYLNLLIKTDEELSKDPTIDQKSFSYNVQLNKQITKWNHYDAYINLHPFFVSVFASPGILLFIQETVPLHEKLHVENGRI